MPKIPFGVQSTDEGRIAALIGKDCPVVMIENDAVMAAGATILQAFGGHFGTQGQIQLGLRFADALITPEPSTLILVATGLIALLAYAWRKRK